MSLSDDDDPFDDLELDEDTLKQLDGVQSAVTNGKQKSKILVPETPPPAPAPARKGPAAAATAIDPIDLESDDIWDESVLRQIDGLEQHHARNTIPSASTSKQQAPIDTITISSSSSNTGGGPLRQRNLFGQPIQDPGTLLLSTQSCNGAAGDVPGARMAKRTKQWDRTAYAQSGAKRLTAPRRRTTASSTPAMASSSSAAADRDDYDDILDDLDDDGDLSGGAAPLTAKQLLPPDSMKLQLDLDAARKFVYPINMTKRDYQFNIVQRALFDNVLVALPTGLGKTFIAAVVILNFFNWYPQGKIVFVAPTKPLVAQQQMACHGICGLPWDVACEMTGNTTKTRRGDEWQQKRIFYMTPQTLDNDIRTGDVDPKDIICLVVDEAHRATGNYAYCQIVAQMQAVNPYFRILALTATPGSNSERVQEVIDNLHISLIELRTEEALDIRQYIHKKHEETMIVPLTDDFRYVRELYLELMQENCEALVKHGLLPNADPSTIHPFRIRSIFKDRSDVLAKKRWLASVIQETAKMADARHHLDIFSIKMFRSRAQEILDSYKKQERKKMKLAQVLNLAASIPDQMHPKMTATIETISEHFEKEEAAGNQNTKVMVFCSLRECVHEIVELLNASPHNLRATPFIGQAADKQGRGLTQKQQQEIITKYKAGTFNVIVATSIGEEGLDIGEVDLIVCYEAVKDSVRMLQRVGRTGRKRDGRIVVLMAEGPESLVWQRSKDTYKGVQQTITAGHSVTLFDDVPRLVPPSIKPVATFEELDQPEFQPEMIGKRKADAAAKSAKAAERTKKRKERHADASKNVPEGALMGFLSASKLKRRNKPSSSSLREGFDSDDDGDDIDGGGGRSGGGSAGSSALLQSMTMSDDSDEQELQRGIVFRTAAREGDGRQDVSAAPVVPSASTTAPQSKALPSKATKSQQGTTARQKDQASVSTSKRQISAMSHAKTAASATTSNGQRTGSAARAPAKKLGARRSTSAQTPLAIESSDTEEQTRRPTAPSVPTPSPPSSPLLAVASAKKPAQAPSSDDEFDVSWSMDASAFADLTQRVTNRHNTVQADQSAVTPAMRGQAHPLIAQLAAQELQSPHRPEAAVNGGSPAPTQMPGRVNRRPGRLAVASSDDIAVQGPGETTSAMGPPALPTRRFRRAAPASTPDDVPQTPEVRRKRQKKQKKAIGRSPTSRALFLVEAERDTDEERRDRRRADSDDDGPSTDEADSSDLEHVGDFQPTQAPRGYNQTSIYHQSLLTQAAPSPFRRRTVGGFVGGRYGIQDGAAAKSQAGPATEDDDDRYSLDSFVCDDEEEVGMASSQVDDGLGEDD